MNRKTGFFEKIRFFLKSSVDLLFCQNKTDRYSFFCALCAVFVTFVVEIRENKLYKTIS